MSAAIAKAAELAKLGDQRGVRYLERQPTFRDQLIDALADSDNDGAAVPEDAFSLIAHQPEQQLASLLAEIRSIMSGPSIQARCLECRTDAPTRIETKDLTLLEMIRSWLG